MTTERDPDFKANPAPSPSDFLAASDAIPSSHHTVTTTTRPEHYPQRIDRAEPPSGSGMGVLLGSGLLSLLMGGAGAWAYENYIGPHLANNQASDKTQASTENTAAGGASELTSKFEDLSEKFRDLETRVANLPKAAPAVDTEAIGKRIEAAEERAQKVEVMNTQLKDLPIKLDEEAKRVTALVTDLETVQKQVTELRTDMSAVASKTEKALKPGGEASTAAAKPGESQTSAADSEPPQEIEKLDVTTLAEGIALFQHGDYAKANEFFNPLTKTRADDARVWYYAALSRGLATRDWKGETEDLVKEGVKREKAGQPDKSEIDATFIGLTTATGKDWLGFYRKQAE